MNLKNLEIMETNKARRIREAKEIAEEKKRDRIEERERKAINRKRAKPYLHLVRILFQINRKVASGGGSQEELPIGGSAYRFFSVKWDKKKRCCILKRENSEIDYERTLDAYSKQYYRYTGSETCAIVRGKEEELALMLSSLGDFRDMKHVATVRIKLQEALRIIDTPKRSHGQIRGGDPDETWFSDVTG